MLEQPMMDKLLTMRLHGMVDALKTQEQDPAARELSFLERLGLLVDQQWNWRQNQALARRLHAAKLQANACVEEIDYRAARGLDKSVIRGLAQESAWVRNHEQIFILGPTGVGKSFVASPWRKRRAAMDIRPSIHPGCSSVPRSGAGPSRRQPAAAAGQTQPDRRAGDRRLGDRAVDRVGAAGLLGYLRGPLSGPFDDPHVAVTRCPLARADRRPDSGRRHSRPSGPQRASNRHARGLNAQDASCIACSYRLPGFSRTERGTGLPSLSPHPFPGKWPPASASAPDRCGLDEAEHLPDNQKASVATLRWCSASARNSVRLPFGYCVRLRRNPHPSATKKSS